MDYIESFKNLRPIRKYARKSPQKAILLLLIIEMYEEGTITDNRIVYDECLENSYRQLWTELRLENTDLDPDISLPFWAMNAEAFWHFVPVRGKENVLKTLSDLQSTPSEDAIKGCVKYAELDDDLFFLMTLSSGRVSLREALLSTYAELSGYHSTIFTKTLSKDEVMNENPDTIVTQLNGDCMKGDSSIHGLDEDVWLTICISYYTFLKNRVQIRDEFKSRFDSPLTVYRYVCGSDSRAIPSLLKDNVMDFLHDLYFSLMKDDFAEGIVDSVRDKINELDGCPVNYDEVKADVNGEMSFSDYLDTVEVPISDVGVTIQDDASSQDDDTEDVNAIDASQLTGEDFYIENYSSRCAIFDRDTSKIYNSTGQLKVFDRNPYRLSFVYSKFSVNVIDRTYDGKFKTGDRIICASSSSDLFLSLQQAPNFIDAVLNILYEGHIESWIINVKGSWYDSDGHLFMPPKTVVIEAPEQEAKDIADDVDTQNVSDSEGSFDYIPKGKLKKIEERAETSYDYLWTMAIIDLVKLTNRSGSLSFDTIACMMLANAWVLLSDSDKAKEIEYKLNTCISFLQRVACTKEGVALTWDSTKEEVFNAIKDFPMSGVFEEVIDKMLETSPVNVLKTWYSDLSDKEAIIESINFTRPALYALYSRKVDPYIVLNKKWLNNLYYEHDNLIKYFSIRYMDFLERCIDDDGE